MTIVCVCVCVCALSLSLFLTFRLCRGGGLRPGRFLQSPHDVFTIHNHNTYIVHCRDRIVLFFFVFHTRRRSARPVVICLPRLQTLALFFPPEPCPFIITILPGFLRMFYSFSYPVRIL